MALLRSRGLPAAGRDLSSSLSKTEDLNRAISNFQFFFILPVLHSSLLPEAYCSKIEPSMEERKLRRGPHRRSERLPAQMPVQLAGADETGQQFTENSETLTLSQHGASILSKRKFRPNHRITIRRPDTGKEAQVRIAGRIGDRVEGYVYAVEFVDPQANLWDMEFPSAPDLGETEDLAFLVCGCCGKSEAVQLGESKLADFEQAHGVLLYCIQCQAMTRWMQSDEPPPGDRRGA